MESEGGTVNAGEKEKENHRRIQQARTRIWFNPHFQRKSQAQGRPSPPSRAHVQGQAQGRDDRGRPQSATSIHVNPAFQAQQNKTSPRSLLAGQSGNVVHINPHKLLPKTKTTPNPDKPAVPRQILVNPNFAQPPKVLTTPSSTPSSKWPPLTAPSRSLGLSGRSLAKFKKIGRHKLIKRPGPSPFSATPTAPYGKFKALAHLRRILTPKSRLSVHRKIDRRPSPRPSTSPRPSHSSLVPSTRGRKPVAPPKPARTIQINGAAYRVSRNGRQLQRVHPRASPPNGAPTPTPSKKVYLAREGEFVEATPGILRLSRESMTRQSITQARKKSIQTLLRSQTKSKQFCMFYNKFGRCQKRAQGLCPYLHDPAKVAVCRRFLNGSCPKSPEECLLTHKVSPDKMPACKFFQLGQCGRDHCPYNHVKVSEDAAICRPFLRGFCAKGQSCTLRHEMPDTKSKKTVKRPKSANPAPPKPKRKVIREPKTEEKVEANHQRYFECGRDEDAPTTGSDPPKTDEKNESQLAYWPEFIALECDPENENEAQKSFEERLV